MFRSNFDTKGSTVISRQIKLDVQEVPVHQFLLNNLQLGNFQPFYGAD